MATEFDFDELDKAVNSLMKDKDADDPTTAPVEANPAPAAVPSTPVPPAPLPSNDELPAATPPGPDAIPTPTVAAETTPAPAVVTPKSSGRFMDVVHPSSDMRTASPVVSREGTSLSPLSTPGTLTPKTSPATVKDTDQSVVEDANNSSGNLPSSPITSPFLPDTQVEKRPLGGEPPASASSLDEAMATELSATPEDAPSPEGTDPTSSGLTEESSVDASPTESTSTPEDNNDEQAGLPEELNKDLVAIESGEAQSSGEAVAETSDVSPTSIATNSSVEQGASSSTALLSQSSIPQQYEEQATSTAEAHAPIYDDQTTAQALNHPVKKSGLRVLVIAGAIVLVGIVSAIGIYFLQFSS